MISAWNLAWIIPIAAGFGMFIMALLTAAGNNRSDDE